MTEPEEESLLTRLRTRITEVFRETPRRKKKKPKVKVKTSTIRDYSHFSFRLFGGRVQLFERYLQDLKPNLQKAGMKITVRSYVSLMILTSMIGFIVPMVASVILGIVFKTALVGILLLGGALGLLCWAVAFIVCYSYPSIKADSRSRQIEAELPYVISHMAVLATAGVPPERIFRSVAMTDGALVSQEMTDVVRDVDLLGKDIITALESASDRSSSRDFSEVSEGLIATVISGGDIRRYLYDKAKSLMQLKMIRAKELSETLSIVGECYVTLLIVFPLVVMIMFTVMASVSSSLAGYNIIMLMYLLAYVLVPLCAAAMIILLDALIPSYTMGW